MKRLLCTACIIVLLCGCAHYPDNPKLNEYNKTKGYRFDNLSAPADADRLFIILAFSGGGTRAAALSYGVLETLQDTRFVWQGTERSLLDEVDVISSVSGGSFTAAYYALFREDIFKSFEERFLYRNIQGELTGLVMMPTSWFKLVSPDYSRIDLAENFYHREIFEKKRFDDLIQRNQRPMVIINATDMTIGTPFTFTQAQFDPICSDLLGVTVSRAVAASSCFPVAFAPMTLNNYAGTCHYREPDWVELAIEDLQLNPPRYARARALQSYNNASSRPYLHLLDGGVADNIGLRGPLASIRSNDPDLSVLRRINDGAIDHLVVIIVDAKTKQVTEVDKSSSPPGLKTVLTKIATVPLDNYSFDTVQALRDEFKRLEADSRNYEDCKETLKSACPNAKMPFDPPREVKLYPIYVGFDQIADAKERRYFQTMDTSFYLPDQQVTDLRKIARTLLEKSDEFHKLKTELEAKIQTSQ
jgi:predicted acylesterase/phospholipase RssA